jgi:hypothetical protein
MPTTEITTTLHDLHSNAGQLSEIVREIKDHLVKLSDNETQNNQLQQHSQIIDLQRTEGHTGES